MLKIYLCTVQYEIHNDGKIVHLNTDSDYVICDTTIAVPKTKSYGAYTNEAQGVYVFASRLEQKRKGKSAYFYGWPMDVTLQQWRAPNAKLVAHVTYKECNCSMQQLMKLPVDDVIAYLKQEGLNLVVTS